MTFCMTGLMCHLDKQMWNEDSDGFITLAPVTDQTVWLDVVQAAKQVNQTDSCVKVLRQHNLPPLPPLLLHYTDFLFIETSNFIL